MSKDEMYRRNNKSMAFHVYHNGEFVCCFTGGNDALKYIKDNFKLPKFGLAIEQYTIKIEDL